MADVRSTDIEGGSRNPIRSGGELHLTKSSSFNRNPRLLSQIRGNMENCWMRRIAHWQGDTIGKLRLDSRNGDFQLINLSLVKAAARSEPNINRRKL